ncbi:MAG: right-handed parallel beta-helix repeat-containing protein [Planctomycetota bacterium]
MKTLRGTLSVVPVVFALLSPNAECRVIHVPADTPTIQGAIDAASDGDTVLVAPGIYPESIDFLGKAITVQSSHGPQVTIVDAQRTDNRSVVFFWHGEGSQSVLEGFTLTNGVGWNVGPMPGNGGGLFIDNASPVVRGNIVTGNHVGGSGGGIFVSGPASPTIVDNVIESNSALGLGGGIYCGYADFLVVSGNVISGNVAERGGGLFVHTARDLTLSGNVIRGNVAGEGGGIDLVDTGAVLTECLVTGNEAGNGGGLYYSGIGLTTLILSGFTIADNTALVHGGGIYERDGFSVVYSSILWGNEAIGGAQIYVAPEGETGDGTPRLRYCDIEGGWWGWGGLFIDQDPRFVDPASDDYRLESDSPCIDVGDPGDRFCRTDVGGHPRQLDGSLDGVQRIDMGAHEFGHVSLDVTGDATPGGTLILHTTGTAGLPVLLLGGTAPGQWCHPYLGAFFLDWSAPWRLFSWRLIPSIVAVSIPPAIPTPLPLILQEVTILPSVPAGNASNAVSLLIE